MPREIPFLFTRAMVLALLAGRKTQTRRLALPYVARPGAGPLPDGVFVPNDSPAGPAYRPAPAAVGDLGWVRETWRTYRSLNGERPVDLWHPDKERGAAIFYDAGGSMFISRGVGEREWSQDDEDEHPGAGKTRTSLHLPRWASRLTLRITDVRMERLQDISAEDALAEGIERQDPTAEDVEWERSSAEEHGRQPEDLEPIWIAPGTRQGFGPRPDAPLWGPTPQFAYRCLWESIHGLGTWGENPLVHAYTFDVMRENIGRVRAGQEENDHGNP